MPWFENKGSNLILNIRAVPRSSNDSIQGLMGDALKVRIQAPPAEGKANAYLIKYLSRLWKIPRSSIELVSGETTRNKRLCINNPPDELRTLLLSYENE